MTERPIKAIINYKDFLRMKEYLLKDFLENEYVELLISIKKDEYKSLNIEEKKMLYGFRRTEMPPIKAQRVAMEKIFKIENLSEQKCADKELKQSFKEKHRQMSRPPAPRKILNLNYNSHKKGGR